MSGLPLASDRSREARAVEGARLSGIRHLHGRETSRNMSVENPENTPRAYRRRLARPQIRPRLSQRSRAARGDRGNSRACRPRAVGDQCPALGRACGRRRDAAGARTRDPRSSRDLSRRRARGIPAFGQAQGALHFEDAQARQGHVFADRHPEGRRSGELGRNGAATTNSSTRRSASSSRSTRISTA